METSNTKIIVMSVTIDMINTMADNKNIEAVKMVNWVNSYDIDTSNTGYIILN